MLLELSTYFFNLVWQLWVIDGAHLQKQSLAIIIYKLRASLQLNIIQATPNKDCYGYG